jgi:hypothetical protein
MPVMTASALAMTDEQRFQLEAMARSHTLPHRKVLQAQALLLAADGVATNEVARRCKTTDTSVRGWRAAGAAAIRGRRDRRGRADRQGAKSAVVVAGRHGGRGGPCDAQRAAR